MQKRDKQRRLDSGLSYKYVQFELLMYFTKKIGQQRAEEVKLFHMGSWFLPVLFRLLLMIT